MYKYSNFRSKYFVIYFYIVLLLLNVIIILCALDRCVKCPAKIGILSSIVLVLLLARYISLFIMYISKNINYMYMLKPFYFLYVICIPICSLIITYIVIRNDKLKFMHVIIISSVIIVIYELLITKIPVYISINEDCGLGYVMVLKEYSFFIDIFSLIVNIIFLLVAISLFNKKNTYALFLMMLAALTSIICIVISYTGIYTMPQCVLGELLWIITLNYCLGKVKKRNNI